MTSVALLPTNTVLVSAMAALLRQLVAKLETLLQGRTFQASVASELALADSSLCQLQSWLPPEHELQMRLRHLHKLLPALLQEQTPPVRVSLLAYVYALQHALPAADTMALQDYRQQARTTALKPLSLLWRWQQPVADERSQVAGIILPLLAALLQQVSTTVRSGCPSAKVLGEHFNRMAVLLEFGGTATEQQIFSTIAPSLSLAILQPPLVSPHAVQSLWQQLHGLLQQQPLPASAPSTCDDLALLQAAHSDLGRDRRLLLQWLSRTDINASDKTDAGLFPHAALVLHCRLPWILAAVGQNALAGLFHHWYQFLQLHWQFRLPLSEKAMLLWRNNLAALDPLHWTALSARQPAQWLWLLLREWPHIPASPVLHIALQQRGVAQGSPVQLAHIPDLLAQSLTTITRIEPDWCLPETFAVHAPTLSAELCLLERGAAAVRMHGIERYCSLLLALHHRLQRPALLAEFPADLLWRSYQHLLELLDEAALWQIPQADPALCAELKRWLRQQQQAAVLRVCEPEADSGSAMVERLQRFIDELTQAVDQTVRFSATLDAALTPEQLSVCEPALIELLRFLVLEQVKNLSQRRLELKPLATNLTLNLMGTEDGVAAEIMEEGMEIAPDSQTLKRLRHLLPAQVQRLHCSTRQGQGRCFRFVVEQQ